MTRWAVTGSFFAGCLVSALALVLVGRVAPPEDFSADPDVPEEVSSTEG